MWDTVAVYNGCDNELWGFRSGTFMMDAFKLEQGISLPSWVFSNTEWKTEQQGFMCDTGITVDHLQPAEIMILLARACTQLNNCHWEWCHQRSVLGIGAWSYFISGKNMG